MAEINGKDIYSGSQYTISYFALFQKINLFLDCKSCYNIRTSFMTTGIDIIILRLHILLSYLSLCSHVRTGTSRCKN